MWRRHTSEGAQAALALRGDLGLGTELPIDDILRTVEEEVGVPVVVLELPDGLAGLYRRRLGESLIAINGNDPAVRRRFTLAHELGHHSLGHSTVVDRAKDITAPTHPQEREANAFAAEFLMPRNAVTLWLERHGGEIIDLEVVVRMANYFGVSAMSARVRLESTKRIGSQKAHQLDAEIQERAHLDLARQLNLPPKYDALQAIERDDLPRLPHEMMTRAKRLHEADLLTLDDIASQLGRSRESLELELSGKEEFEEVPF